MDALRGQISKNWSMVAGLTDVAQVVVEVRVQLDRSGRLSGGLRFPQPAGRKARAVRWRAVRSALS